MIGKLKPVIVLSAICLLVCALLIVTYNLTYVDTSGIMTDNLTKACVAIDGEDEFALVTDRTSAELDGDEYKDIVKIVKNKTDGTFLFEVVVDGYAADGIDIVIGFNKEGAVNGLSVVALQETPGLGTKINDDKFLSLFEGRADSVTISKNPPKNDNEIQAITGSTYSSKGLAKAVNLALKAYGNMNKEVEVQ